MSPCESVTRRCQKLNSNIAMCKAAAVNLMRGGGSRLSILIRAIEDGSSRSHGPIKLSGDCHLSNDGLLPPTSTLEQAAVWREESALGRLYVHSTEPWCCGIPPNSVSPKGAQAPSSHIVPQTECGK